ncbi:MAG: branched-chain amino acid ABC transporter permease [Desulfurococcaceae archaeon]
MNWRTGLFGSLVPSLAVLLALTVARILYPASSQLVFLLAFYVALGSAFNLFTGLSGYVCFGYSAFVAMGSYGMALAFRALGGSGWTPSVPLVVAEGLAYGVALAALLAIVVGGVALRLREVYFAIATLGLSRAIRFFIEGTGIWGGSEGILLTRHIIDSYGYGLLPALSIDLPDYMTLALAAITAVISYVTIRSRMGYALFAIREDEDVAAVMGVNTTLYKVLAFVLSATLAGLLGSAKVLKDQAVYPADAFALIYTIEAIIVTLIGGSGTLLGPVLGGILYGALKYFLTTSFPGLQLLILAPLMIVIVVSFPYGILGWLRRRYKSLRALLI